MNATVTTRRGKRLSVNRPGPIARRAAILAAAEVYGPDGVPLSGPRTTAAYYSDLFGINTDPQRLRHPVPPAMWADYRAAADYEAAAWSHAVREGRALRFSAAHHPPVPFLDMDDAATIETQRGIPVKWSRPSKSGGRS